MDWRENRELAFWATVLAVVVLAVAVWFVTGVVSGLMQQVRE